MPVNITNAYEQVGSNQTVRSPRRTNKSVFDVGSLRNVLFCREQIHLVLLVLWNVWVHSAIAIAIICE